MFSEVIKPQIEELNSTFLKAKKVRVLVQREDLIHPYISGNKWRKLKYNFLYALENGFSKILTFGGAFSNHILATAAAAYHMDMQSIGMIRGEECMPLNPTLSQAKLFGMNFKYIDRSSYRLKVAKDWKIDFPDYYIIPEGGTNILAVKGCEEILSGLDFDIVCCSCGTGGTMAGIINSLQSHQKMIGFPVFKRSDFLKKIIQNYVFSDRWDICYDYHFGGYAKVNKCLIEFINNFKNQYKIPLDPVYTGKMFYGVFDLISKSYFREGTTILLIHTGGLQGILGMNEQIQKKGWHIE